MSKERVALKFFLSVADGFAQLRETSAFKDANEPCKSAKRLVANNTIINVEIRHDSITPAFYHPPSDRGSFRLLNFRVDKRSDHGM